MRVLNFFKPFRDFFEVLLRLKIKNQKTSEQNEQHAQHQQ
jgi:hypothetical protein